MPIPLVRYSDWSARLDYFLAINRRHAFTYGTWDCCIFVADAIQIMTGTDIAAPFRADGEFAYSSRRTARAAAESYCGSPSVDCLAANIATEYQMQEIPYRMAQRGDMVSIRRPLGPSLGLISPNGREILIAAEIRDTGEDGVGAIPISNVIHAWRVG